MRPQDAGGIEATAEPRAHGSGKSHVEQALDLLGSGKPEAAVAYARGHFTRAIEARQLLGASAHLDQPGTSRKIAEFGMGLVGKGGDAPEAVESDIKFLESVRIVFASSHPFYPGHNDDDIALRAARAAFELRPGAESYGWFKSFAGARWPEFREGAIAHARARTTVPGMIEIMIEDGDAPGAIEVYGDGSKVPENSFFRMVVRVGLDRPDWVAKASGDRIEARLRQGDAQGPADAFGFLVRTTGDLVLRCHFEEASEIADRMHGLAGLTDKTKRRVSDLKSRIEDKRQAAAGPSM